MIDPGLIIEVIKAGKAVYDQAQAVKTLKPLSDDLADRAQTLAETLEQAGNIQDNQSLEDSLRRIQKILDEDCQHYIQKLSKTDVKAKLRRFIQAHTYIEKHDRLMEQLDSALNDINLALNVKSIISQEKHEAKRRAFEKNTKLALRELQEFAIQTLQKSTSGEESLGELKETLQEVKAKLNAMQQEIHKKDPANVPPTITLNILAKGAKAERLEHETILGIAMGDISTPEDSSRSTINTVKELASFALAETLKVKEQQEKPNIVVNMLEAEAYAPLVITRVREAQPGKVTLTERTSSIAPGSAATAGKEASKRTAASASAAQTRSATQADSSDEELDKATVLPSGGPNLAKKP